MKVLVDSDVLFDVAFAREPFAKDSMRVLQWAQDKGGAAIAWHSMAVVSYMLKDKARPFLQMLLKFADVAPVESIHARQALTFPIKDLEDAMQASAALSWGAEWLITRNVRHYRDSPVPAISPTDFLCQVSEAKRKQ